MSDMKIAVIGASGRIGRKLVLKLRQDDCQVVEAAPTFGVNAVTGQGLAAALEGAEVVVDVSNSPSLDGEAAIRFFETAGRNIAAASDAAGVQHRVALSIVGTDRLQASAYFRAKKIQEDLLKTSSIPFTILRSTQFFEFIAGVVQGGGQDDVKVSPARAQPIAVMNVAETLAAIATAAPLNRTVEVAGPERFKLDDLTTEVLTAYEDQRCVVTDTNAPYFGAILDEHCLLPGEDANIADLRFEDWLRQSLQPDRLQSGAS
jgi:uncharacterized protein YbjT (DUF2867 family)